MKNVAILAIPLLVLSQSCNLKQNEKIKIHPKFPNEYKYEIEGYVYVSKGQLHEAVFYTDTFTPVGPGLVYENSDGSETLILPPYQIKHIK